MEGKNKIKKPMSRKAIFKLMLYVAYIVSAIFLLKNVIGKNMQGAGVIATVMVVLGIVLIVLKKRNAKTEIMEIAISIGLVFVVFFISLYSGEYYSDDFPMMLALIGMAGLYMEPKYTKIQIVFIDIAFVLMYIIHPENTESLSQYIMCVGIFNLAALLFYQTIKRGRAFMDISTEKADAAKALLTSMDVMGEELQNDFEASVKSIDINSVELQKGSEVVLQSAKDMTDCCIDVQDKIRESGRQIVALDEGVKNVEVVLMENKSNIEEMTKQMAVVSDAMRETQKVFAIMQEKMQEIAKVSKQLSDISFNTTILSLNASVEAARAGEAGAGFEVVATEVRRLSDNSNECSDKVSEIVKDLNKQVDATADQITDSFSALEGSVAVMSELQHSFVRLTEQFGTLYNNIAAQNSSVGQVDSIFARLKNSVDEMSVSSETNKQAVEAIMETMNTYKVNINKVINETRQVQQKVV